MNILCKIGIHKFKVIQNWIPDIKAPIVTEFHICLKCLKCGREKGNIRLIWNGECMVNAEYTPTAPAAAPRRSLIQVLRNQQQMIQLEQQQQNREQIMYNARPIRHGVFN